MTLKLSSNYVTRPIAVALRVLGTPPYSPVAIRNNTVKAMSVTSTSAAEKPLNINLKDRVPQQNVLFQGTNYYIDVYLPQTDLEYDEMETDKQKWLKKGFDKNALVAFVLEAEVK